MSRLYASIDADASKTQATRRGHKYISAHVRGLDDGVEVHAYVGLDGLDVFDIYQTRGSNSSMNPKLIATVVDGKVTLPISVQ